jgi:hypothetical protein
MPERAVGAVTLPFFHALFQRPDMAFRDRLKPNTGEVTLGNLAFVAEAEPGEKAEDESTASAPDTTASAPDTTASAPDTAEADAGHAPVFSAFGIASTALAVLSVAAIVLATIIWLGHRHNTESLNYQSRVAQAAADWTSVLINMNKDNIDSSLEKLHDGTVGELNNDFEAAMQPYRSLVQTLQSKTTGQINSVSIEAVHHDLDASPPSPPAAVPDLSSRTDTVLIVATSVSQIAAAKPQTVHWNLRIGVSNVDGKLMISRLEPIR